jgi:hypothetical protein
MKFSQCNSPVLLMIKSLKYIYLHIYIHIYIYTYISLNFSSFICLSTYLSIIHLNEHGRRPFFLTCSGSWIFFPGVVHSPRLFCDGHDRKSGVLFVKESMFATNMFEKPFKSNPFWLEWLALWAAKATETWELSILHVWIVGDKDGRRTSCIWDLQKRFSF